MPWFLQTSVRGSEASFLLHVGIKFTVGRSRECALQFEGDAAISRLHGEFVLEAGAVSKVTLKDCSKFGVWVNGSKWPQGVCTALNNGDQIKFGLNNVLVLKFEPVVLCCSRLPRALKKTLDATALELAVPVVERWSDEVTHLVMDSLGATEKALWALIDDKPIVSPEWLTKIESLPLPDPALFSPRPEGIVSTACLRTPKGVRRTLLQGKTVVFLCDVPALQANIVKCGGKTLLCEAEQSEEFWLSLKDFAVVAPPEGEQPPAFKQLKALWPTLAFINQANIGTAMFEARLDEMEFHPAFVASSGLV